MTVHEVFSKNLSQLAARRGLSQADIARLMEVSKPTVSGWFNGTKVPRMNKAHRLAELLGVEVSTLVDENGFETFDNQTDPGLLNINQLHAKRVPLVGGVAAGEPINDAEFPGTFVTSPMNCDFALQVHGDSMEPTYLEDDIVYVQSASALPYDGAIVVLRIGNGDCTEHCIKHVIQTDAGIVIMSDNPAYPAKLITPDQSPTIIGIPVGYTRMYKKARAH